jgi:excisionase family DNA binding protein
MANSLTQPGGHSGAAVGTDIAVGVAMAQQLMAQGLVTPAGTKTAPAAAEPTADAAFDLLSPADAARLLGVNEADVLASIESGDLKAKKIGTAYRISRPVLQEFIQK